MDKLNEQVTSAWVNVIGTMTWYPLRLKRELWRMSKVTECEDEQLMYLVIASTFIGLNPEKLALGHLGHPFNTLQYQYCHYLSAPDLKYGEDLEDPPALPAEIVPDLPNYRVTIPDLQLLARRAGLTVPTFTKEEYRNAARVQLLVSCAEP